MQKEDKIFYEHLEDLYRIGNYKKLVRLCRRYRLSKCFSERVSRLEIISLLVLEKENKAWNLFKSLGGKSVFSYDFSKLLRRYVFRKSLEPQVEKVVSTTRDLLRVSFLKKTPPPYVEKISKFSDIILLSNSTSWRFSHSEIELLKHLENPLFVYLNIGNPVIASLRDQFYNERSSELLIGGHHHVVDKDSELLFTPYSYEKFLGCIVRVNNKFQKLWHEELCHKAELVNPKIQFFEFEESLLIESSYPLSTYRASDRSLKKRIPSIGWLAISLLDSISFFNSNASPKLWLGGFSLNPGYIFRASGNLQQHDFPFEKQALAYRSLKNQCSSIGSFDLDLEELSSLSQVNSMYGKRVQLSYYLRKNKLI